MRECNLREVRELMRYSVTQRKSMTILGSPGLGKTAIVNQVAAELDHSVMTFEGVSLDPTDVRGVLIPTGEASIWTRSPMLPDPEKHGDRGILLIDDLPGADRDVQKALFPLFHPQDRRIGSDRLPPGWIPIATGNRTKDSSGASAILAALADRTLLIHARPDLEVWRQDFAVPNRLHPMVLAYLGFRSDHFDTFENRRRDRQKDFATPRGWADVSDVMNRDEQKAFSSDIVREAGIQGYIGESVAIEFLGYLKVKNKLPDVNEIFRGKYVIPEEPSVVHALVAILARKLLDKPPVKKSVAIDRVLEYSLKLDAVFGGILIADIYKECRANILKSKFWAQVARRYFP